MVERLTQEEIRWLLVSLRKIDFFATASLFNIDKIVSLFSKFEFKKGDKIINEGDSGLALYVIKTGFCQVYKSKGFFGKEKIAELKEGDFFGEMSLIFDAPASATVKCLSPVQIYAYMRSDFIKFLAENREFEKDIQHIAERRKFEISILDGKRK